MLEGETLKEIVIKLIDHIHAREMLDIFMEAIDKYAGNDSYSSWDAYEYIIKRQLDLIEKIKKKGMEK